MTQSDFETAKTPQRISCDFLFMLLSRVCDCYKERGSKRGKSVDSGPANKIAQSRIQRANQRADQKVFGGWFNTLIYSWLMYQLRRMVDSENAVNFCATSCLVGPVVYRVAYAFEMRYIWNVHDAVLD